jgi:hypothetical protein
MSDQPPSANKWPQRLVGGIIMACGALVATLCGLCSAALLFPPGPSGQPPVFDWHQNGTLMMVAIIGGVPFCAGVMTFLVGLLIFRRR